MEEKNYSTASPTEIQELLILAEKTLMKNLVQGKSAQSAITITCIALGMNPSPLAENIVLDHLWEKVYRDLPEDDYR